MAATPDSIPLVDPVTEQDHILGDPNAPITIVEYGDYECPSCLNAVPIVKEVRQMLGDKLRFVFRHFPQSSIHPHASRAAESAEAAGEQGKFWEMHEELFKHQKELDLDPTHLALLIGLEIYRFESSRAADKHRKRVESDYESGKRNGITKTPTFFVNGLKYTGKIDAPSIAAASRA